MTNRLIHTPQPNDAGSEGGLGYAYQYHLAVRKCIEMLAGRIVDVVICEFHEDIIEIRRTDLGLGLHQVKKKESGVWRLGDLIKPEKGQAKGVLAKLFEKLQVGKDVRTLTLEGYGRCSGNEEHSLPELILLLNAPMASRDEEWELIRQKYIDHLAEKLAKQQITRDTVGRAIGVLRIDFSSPHPHAIRSKNEETLEKFMRSAFQVELTVPEVKTIYTDLYERVSQISVQPKQSWDTKSLSRAGVTSIISRRLKEFRPLATREHYQSLQEKLTSADLGEKVNYAREVRIESLILRYELDMKSLQWKRFKADINTEWQRFRNDHPSTKGAELWKALLGVFEKLGSTWTGLDPRLDSDFVEGVFFDMTAVCETKWRG